MTTTIILLCFIAVFTIISLAIRKKSQLAKTSINQFIKNLKKNGIELTHSLTLMADKRCYTQKMLLTANEINWLKVLRTQLSEDYTIIFQISVLALVEPNKTFARNSKAFKALFGQISQWRVDFAIVNLTDNTVAAVIELDDASHFRPDRVKRDIILNEVMQQATIPLIRGFKPTDILTQLRDRQLLKSETMPVMPLHRPSQKQSVSSA